MKFESPAARAVFGHLREVVGPERYEAFVTALRRDGWPPSEAAYDAAVDALVEGVPLSTALEWTTSLVAAFTAVAAPPSTRQ